MSLSSDIAASSAPVGEEPEGPMLVVTDLSVSFAGPRGRLVAVEDVSFTLERGRTLGIVGESGSGKTVLSRSVMGLTRSSTEERVGSVRYLGQELVGASPSRLRKLWGTELAMVFQDPMTSLNPVVRIGRQITESIRYHEGASRAVAADRAVELLRSVGIPDPARRIGQFPHELSGGMRQRVTIAMALACSPGIIFADEPTTALDVTVQAQILDLLASQQAQRNMAMVLVTHDLGVVAGRTDEIAVMYAGQIVERASTRDLFTRVRMPYTRALLDSIPRMEQPRHSRLSTIPGRPPDLTDRPPGCRFAPRCAYVQPICETEAPPLVRDDVTFHEHRCWFPLDGTGDAGSPVAEPTRAVGGR